MLPETKEVGSPFLSCQVVALLLALFMPDIWVLAGVNDTLGIDIVWNPRCSYGGLLGVRIGDAFMDEPVLRVWNMSLRQRVVPEACRLLLALLLVFLTAKDQSKRNAAQNPRLDGQGPLLYDPALRGPDVGHGALHDRVAVAQRCCRGLSLGKQDGGRDLRVSF